MASARVCEKDIIAHFDATQTLEASRHQNCSSLIRSSTGKREELLRVLNMRQQMFENELKEAEHGLHRLGNEQVCTHLAIGSHAQTSFVDWSCQRIWFTPHPVIMFRVSTRIVQSKNC